MHRWAAAVVLVLCASMGAANAQVHPECDGTPISGLTAPELLRRSRICTEHARRTGSLSSAISAAYLLISLSDYAGVRRVLAPFVDIDDPRVLNLLAYADNRLGDKALAMARYQRAIELGRKWVDPDPWRFAAQMYAYELAAQDDLPRAIQVLDDLQRQPFREGTKVGLYYLRQASLQLAQLLYRLGNVTAAERQFERSRQLTEGLPPLPFQLIIEGQLRFERGQLETAAQLFEEARKASRISGKRLYEVSAIDNLVQVALKRKAWAEARGLARAAMALEGLQDEDRRDHALYDAIAARELGDLSGSLALLEQARTLAPMPPRTWQILFELGNTLAGLKRTAEAEAAYRRSIAEIEGQRTRMKDPGLQSWLMESRRGPYEALFELLARRGDFEGARRTIERFLAFRITDDIAAAAREAAIEPRAAVESQAAVQEVIVASDAAATLLASSPSGGSSVAFIETARGLWRVTAMRAQLNVRALPVDHSELCALARDFSAEPDDDVTAGRIGEALFPPSLLTALGERFSVVLPRCAPNLPVGALLIGGKRLVERAVVTLAPDLLTARRTAAVDAATAELVMGDPRGDLPAARAEAVAVAGQLHLEPVLGAQATRERLLGASSRRLLHLATHTVVEARGPALLLANGSVSVGDILRAKLSAGLVVLATCRSGSQLESTARDTLAATFLRSGSRNVVATFRSVDDALTARVVEQFYAAGGLRDAAGALTHVQRALLATERPSRWAAFFVAGTPRPAHSGGPLSSAPGR